MKPKRDWETEEGVTILSREEAEQLYPGTVQRQDSALEEADYAEQRKLDKHHPAYGLRDKDDQDD